MNDVTLILRALHFAALKHRDQRRKDVHASPYINHPVAVAQTLTYVGAVTDSSVLVAAILHDTVEDTETTHDEIEREFGTTVAGIVREVSVDKALPRAERKRLQVEHAPHISPQGALVKIADKIANIEDIARNPPREWGVERCLAYIDWAAEVVGNLPDVNPSLQAHFDHTMAAARRAFEGPPVE